MRFLPTVKDDEKELFSLILVSIKQFGDENMLIKIFESAKYIKYIEYCYFCTKFKEGSKVVWEDRKIDTTNVRLNIHYYRDINNQGNNLLTEVKNIDYDMKSLKKKTFSGKNRQNKTEKIFFELQYKCQNCGEPHDMMNLTINLSDKVKSQLMICKKCKKYMEPTTYVTNGDEKIDFVIFSPIKLLQIAREITLEYGCKINIDELRSKYCSFYWNCILYFYFAGLSYEMLLKYKNKNLINENKPKKPKKKIFRKLIIEKQIMNI